MSCERKRIAGVLLVVWIVMGCQAAQCDPRVQESTRATAPVHELGDGAYIRQWLVVGPFPNPAEGSTRAGYDTDYLTELGGESQAVLTPETVVTYLDEDGVSREAAAGLIEAGGDAVVNVDKHFNGVDYKVAYAFAYIHCDRDQNAHCFLGSDDWAKVWINGEQVLANWSGSGRGCRPRQDDFPIALRSGLNAVLVKLEDYVATWEFIFEVVSAEEADKILVEHKRLLKIREFQDIKVEPKVEWDFTFSSGSFPEIVWERQELVRELWGEMPLTIRWFDGKLNEVESPAEPGRYAAYIEGTAENGQKVRRALTFYCSEPDWTPYWNPPEIESVPYIPSKLIEESVWERYSEYIGRAAGRHFVNMLESEEKGAILLAGLSELEALDRKPTQLEWPEMLNQDYHLALKLKLLGIEGKWPKLKPPRRKSTAAPVLRAGAPTDAGVKADAADRIRKACRGWYEASGQPFTVLIARRGVIVIHEAFGNTEKRAIDLDTHFPLASLTKSHAGLLFAQFVDQGLIDVDDPVGEFLPDFPTRGDRAITLRHCLTHTTGLEGHGEWGGMSNPWLDNVIANAVDGLKPGKVAVYNGMGFDLAGKVMEVVSGKSIFRLFHENFFIPLGQDDPTIVDLGYGIDCTVADLARVGQLMLNRGSYGDLEFFSPETFDKLMPRPYKDVFPGLPHSEWDYGLGITWTRQPHPDAGKDGVPEDRTILSKNTIGHGAASSTILRVDLDNELVVAMCRFTAGDDYNKHIVRFLQAVEDGLE